MNLRKTILAPAALLAGGLFVVPSQAQVAPGSTGTPVATTVTTTGTGVTTVRTTSGAALTNAAGIGGFAGTGGIGTIGGIGTGAGPGGGIGSTGGTGGIAGTAGTGVRAGLNSGGFGSAGVGTRGGREVGVGTRLGTNAGTRGGGEIGIGDASNGAGLLPPIGTRGGNDRGIGLVNQVGVGAPTRGPFGSTFGNAGLGTNGSRLGLGTGMPTGFDRTGFRFRQAGVGTSTTAGPLVGPFGLGTSATAVSPAQGDAGSTLFNDTNGLFNTR